MGYTYKTNVYGNLPSCFAYLHPVFRQAGWQGRERISVLLYDYNQILCNLSASNFFVILVTPQTSAGGPVLAILYVPQATQQV